MSKDIKVYFYSKKMTNAIPSHETYSYLDNHETIILFLCIFLKSNLLASSLYLWELMDALEENPTSVSRNGLDPNINIRKVEATCEIWQILA